MKIVAAAALAIVSMAATPAASAPLYSVAASYDGTSNPAGPFTFGYIDAGLSTFTPFSTSNFSNPCLASAAISCLTGGVEPALGVYKNISGVAQNNVVGTIDVPADALFLHPGTSLLSAVAFTAPVSGFYNFAITFTLLTNQNPTGVDVFGGYGTGTTLDYAYYGLSLPAVLGASYSESGNLSLLAGQSFFLAVGPAGDYRFDSTQLDFTMQAVPEPASWALLIAGFGLTGAALRRRRSAPASA